MKNVTRFFFALSVVILSMFLMTSAVFAQEVLPAQTGTTPTYVEYELAFPGILPDHPLYKVKVLRDKIMTFITADPKKLADFYLLQTDKGILAAAILVDKNNLPLAQSTALKAEHNFTLLTQQLFRMAEKPDAAFYQKLKTAAAKHQEVLASLAKRTSGDVAKTFETVIDFSKQNIKTITDYQNKRTFEESLLE